MDHIQSRTMQSLLWSFLEQGGTKLVALLVQLILARILSPDAFGALAILLVLTNVADSIAQSGLGTALIQRSDTQDEDYSTAFWLSVAIAVILLTALLVVAPAVASFYKMPELTALMRVLSFVVILNAMNSIQRSYLQRSLDFRGIFKANIVAISASGVLGVIAAIAGFGVWALVVQALLQSLCACIVFFLVVPWRPSMHFDAGVAKELLSYGWKICATSVLNVVYTGVSELIIGRTCSVSDLGYYSQGRKWPNAAISVMGNALQNVFFPVFSILQKDKERLRTAMRKSLIAGSYLVVPAAIFFTVSAEPVVKLLLTDTWLPCVPVFQAICISNSLMLLQIVNLRVYMALGNSGLYLRLQLVKVVSGVIVIGGTAIVSRDIYTVSVATAIMTFFSILAVDLQPAKRVHGYSLFSQVRDIAPIFIASGIAAVAALLVSRINDYAVAQLLLEAAAFCFVYLAISKVMRLEGFNECRNAFGRLRKEKRD